MCGFSFDIFYLTIRKGKYYNILSIDSNLKFRIQLFAQEDVYGSQRNKDGNKACLPLKQFPVSCS
jgi:hypothetical protein